MVAPGMSPPDPPDLPEVHAGAGTMGAGAFGTGAAAGAIRPPEFSDFRINQAVQQISLAPTEQAAIAAAAAVFQPTRDLPDIVPNTLEHRIAQLRQPPGWLGRLPPPLPWNVDGQKIIEAAFYGYSTLPYLPPATPTGTNPGVQGVPGVPGSTMRRPGNIPRSRTRSARFQNRQRAAPAPPRLPNWTPPANSMQGWLSPFQFLRGSWLQSLSGMTGNAGTGTGRV